MGKSVKKRAPGTVAEVAAPAPGKKKAQPKKSQVKKAAIKKDGVKKAGVKKVAPKKDILKNAAAKKVGPKKKAARRLAALPAPVVLPVPPPLSVGASPAVLDRLWAVVNERRNADPTISHSARLLSRGTAKVAQKFGEEAVECLIEAVGGNRDALVAESADVLYHLIVMWVNAGVRTDDVWAELQRREGVSGIAEKASRARSLPLELGLGTTKIP